ncbi:hypothetical protein Tco_1340402 [Tanacetum coccineum]
MNSQDAFAQTRLINALLSYQQAPAYPRISWCGLGSPSITGFPSILKAEEKEESRSSSTLRSLQTPNDPVPSLLPIISCPILSVRSKYDHTDFQRGNPFDDDFFAEMAHSTWNLKPMPLIEIHPLIFTQGKLGEDDEQ